MPTKEADRHPPKPRLTLRVGITGKRLIPEGEVERIRASLSDVFDALAEFLGLCRDEYRSVLVEGKPALMRIVCGMAEGTDLLAAEVAIERFHGKQKTPSSNVETKLAAILPFARVEYEKDFARTPDKRERTPEELQQFIGRFEAMLVGPAVESVLEIDDEALLDPRRPEARNLAYAYLRDVLLEHVDVLVAVSDDVDGGAGGTVDVMRYAMRGGIPVVKISTTKPGIHVMQAPAPDEPDQTPQEGAAFLRDGAVPGALAAEIDLILAPPKKVSAEPNSPQRRRREGGLAARERLSIFFNEAFEPRYFDRVFKAFRDGLTVKRDDYQLLCSKASAAFRSSWHTYLEKLTSPTKAAEEIWPPAYDRFSDDHGRVAREVLSKRYGWADSLAVRYADATRSAHIMIAALGALAVLMAVTPLVLPEAPDEVGFPIKAAFLTMELIVLTIAALGFFQPAYKGRWHERMVEYRAVAELLRHERFIYALGAADRPDRAADRAWSEPDAWVGWYVRATVRELGFPRKVLSAAARRDVLDTFLRHELQGDYGQISYNASLDERFHTIDHRLEKIVRRGFWITVVAAGAGALLLSLVLLWMSCSGPLDHRTSHWIHEVKPWFTVIAAFVPALIAAIHGIRFQIEFRGTGRRAGATGEELQKVCTDVVAALAKAQPAPGRRRSVRLVRTANAAMSNDLGGWSSVYLSKGPEL